MKNDLEIWTDGACKGNPGPGGYGVLLKYGETEKRLSKGYYETTNNRMELMAACVALEALNKPSTLTLNTDSTYVMKGIQEWMANWKKNNWRTASKKPVKNKDLWLRLDQAVQPHQVHWNWIKGHSGERGNEIADQLASDAALTPEAHDIEAP